MGFLDRLRGTDGGTGAAPAKTVIAAAMPLSGPGVKAISRARTATSEAWQEEAWYYFDVMGELRSPLVWIANAVSQADLHATDIDPDTGKPTGPSDDARAIAVANMAFGGPSQRAGHLKTLALCWQTVGEAWVIVLPQGANGQPDRWLVLSGDKVKVKGGEWSFTDPVTLMTPTLNAGRDLLFRTWSPHPHDQSKADSAVRPALPVLREAEKASQNIAARLDSRIAMNGLMAFAEELGYPKGDFQSSSEAFMDQVMRNAEYGLKNPGQASSQVPIAFEAPMEAIATGGAFAHYDISTAFDATVVDLRDNALGVRLPKTLDMPRQVSAQEQGDGNHWSDWKVEEDTYKIFIEPLLKAIGDAVTEHWFRPALVAMGMTPEQAATKEIGWDTTAIVARPDASETLESLYDKILISDEYFRAEHGVSDDAKPGDEERTRRLLEKIVVGAPTLLADPNVAEALGLDIEVSPVAAGVDATVTSGGELEAPEPESSPVVTNPRGLPSTQGDEPQVEDLPEGLVAAAELLVYDALRRAGGRLLTNQNRGQFKDTPRHELHTVIRMSGGSMGTHSLTEGSFEFTDKVAEAWGMRPSRLKTALQIYVESLLIEGRPHDRAELAWYLR